MARICLLNQFYAPDISPTAQLATSLVEHRAALGDECTVVCGSGGYAPAQHRRPLDPRVTLRRVWSPQLSRSRVLDRAFTYTAYALTAIWTMLRMRRQDVIIAMTTPPFVYLLALAHKLRRREVRIILWSMDVYPEVAERLRPSPFLRPVAAVARRVNAWALPKLDSVVVLDGAMADLLVAAGAPDDRVHRIPNWERAEMYPNADIPPWPGFTELGLDDQFVALYLGNVGIGHEIETLVDAAERLADDDGIRLLFVGGGPRWEELQQRTTHLDTVVTHGYVDKDDTPGVLAGADTAIIVLDERALGVMSPSKLHGSLGMGLPITYIGPAGSNVAEAIDRFDCGVRVANGDPADLVASLRRWRDDAVGRRRSARNARAAFDAAYADSATLASWDELLDGG